MKISDFGIARRVTDSAEQREKDGEQPWGTPRYMSPEQARQDPLSPASDVFSLALLAREIFENRHPLGTLRGRGAAQAIMRGAIGPPRETAGLPDGLCDLLVQMLEMDPRKRPSAGQVARVLQTVQLRLSLDEY